MKGNEVNVGAENHRPTYQFRKRHKINYNEQVLIKKLESTLENKGNKKRTKKKVYARSRRRIKGQPGTPIVEQGPVSKAYLSTWISDSEDEEEEPKKKRLHGRKTKSRIKSESITPAQLNKQLKRACLTSAVVKLSPINFVQSPIEFHDNELDDYRCVFCDFGPVRYQKLKQHERRFHPTCCMLCTLEFETKEAFKNHNLMTHGKRCEICRRNFLKPAYLKAHEKTNYYHFCIESAIQRVHNDMIQKFNLQIEPKMEPVYLGPKKNFIKYPMCEQRTLHESAVITHIGKVSDNLKKLENERIEKLKHQQMDESVKKILTNNFRIAEDTETNAFIQKNSEIFRTLGLAQIQNYSDSVDNCFNVPSVYQPDITSERYIPIASTSEFENDWNFDDTALYAHDEVLLEAIPSLDDLVELNSQSKTFINLDSGQDLSNSKNDLVVPIVGNNVVMIPDGSCGGDFPHSFALVDNFAEFFI